HAQARIWRGVRERHRWLTDDGQAAWFVALRVLPIVHAVVVTEISVGSARRARPAIEVCPKAEAMVAVLALLDSGRYREAMPTPSTSRRASEQPGPAGSAAVGRASLARDKAVSAGPRRRGHG